MPSRVPAQLILPLLIATFMHGQPPPYRDAARSVDERVTDLLGRMTLEEKLAQLQGLGARKTRIQDANGRFRAINAGEVLESGIGQVSRPSEIAGTPVGPQERSPRAQAEFVNDVQRWVIENTRLGIPVMFHEEALHGLAAPRATHFPVPIALASTWDPALVERVMSVAAREARARGCQQVLAPVVDLGRDPRWGRIEERLSYTTFAVSDVVVTPATIDAHGTARVTADVTNTGTRAGDEVVQLYIRDLVSSLTRPTKELRGFERVSLAAGEKKTVTFSLGPDGLSLIDRRMQPIVEPGHFDVMVGTSSVKLTTVALEVMER